MAISNLAAGRRARRLGARSFRRALLEVFEPRVMLSGSFLPVDLTGSWALGGATKSGSLIFDDTGAVTAGSWLNQDGSPETQVVGVGGGRTPTLGPTGAATLNLVTMPLAGQSARACR